MGRGHYRGGCAMKRKNPAAVALGRLGGKAGTGKAKARSHDQAVRAGKIGAAIRWANHRK